VKLAGSGQRVSGGQRFECDGIAGEATLTRFWGGNPRLFDVDAYQSETEGSWAQVPYVSSQGILLWRRIIPGSG
jgi:hypothetical protein